MKDAEAIKEEINQVKEELKQVLSRSNEAYSVGDGWHENAAWEYLQNRVKVLQARLTLLNEQLVEARRRQSK